MSDVMIVMSKAKKYLAEKGFRTSGEVGEALTDHVKQILDVAKERAKERGVKTVGKKHILDAIEEMS